MNGSNSSVASSGSSSPVGSPASVASDKTAFALWNQKANAGTSMHSRRRKPPAFNTADFAGWEHSMRGYLTLRGLWAATERPVGGGGILRSSPADKTGKPIDQIDVTALPNGQSEQLVQSIDAFEYLSEALSGAPLTVSRLVRTVEFGNAYALWTAIKKQHEESTGSTVSALLTQIASAAQRQGEGAVEYGRRLQSYTVELAAVGKEFDEELLKDRYVNHMIPAFAHVAVQLAVQKRRASLAELIELASDIAAATVPHAASHRDSQGSRTERERRTQQAAAAINTAERTNRLCYNCQEPGHIASRCPKNGGTGTAPAKASSSNQGKKQRCEICQRDNHTTEQCRDVEQMRRKILAGNQKGGGNTVGSHSAETHHALAASHFQSQDRWLLDSAASKHMADTHTPLQDVEASGDKIRVASGDVLTQPISGDTTVTLVGGEQIKLKGVLKHSELHTKLMSVSAILGTPEGEVALFTKEKAAVLKPDGTVLLTATARDGLYVVDAMKPGPSTQAANAAACENTLWHRRLAHFSYSTLDDVRRAGVLKEGGAFPREAQHGKCSACMEGKDHRQPFGAQVREELKAKHALYRLHMDTSGPWPEGLNGERYRAGLIDEWSGTGVVFVTNSKEQIPGAIITWCRQAANQQGRKIVELHADGGTEFINAQLKSYCQAEGVKLTWPAPSTPQHNGVAERFNRTIDEATRAMMSWAGAPQSLWPYAALQAARIRNRVLLRSNGATKSPYQLYFGLYEPISVAEFKVWGCNAWTHVPEAQRQGKLAPRSEARIHLGYDHNRQSYVLLDSRSMKVSYSRDVTFEEDSFTLCRELAAADEDESAGGKLGDDWTGISERAETELAKQMSMEPQSSGGSETPNGVRCAASLPPTPQCPVELAVQRQGGDGQPARPQEGKESYQAPQAEDNSRQGAAAAAGKRGNKAFHRLGMVDYTKEVSAHAAEDERAANRAAARENQPISPDRPPIKNGQIKMPTQRCTADTKKGGQCGAKTAHGEYCWNHLRLLCSLRIKPSTPPIKGKGLFAVGDYAAGKSVIDYTGDLVPGGGDDYGGSDYVFELNRQVAIDAARTNTAPGRMVNDARGTNKVSNCKFVVNHRCKTVRLVTTKPVSNGEEFLVSYGTLYWKLKNKGKPTARKTGSKQMAAHSAEALPIHPQSMELGDPATYKQILSRPDRAQWLASRELEHQAHIKLGTYVLVNADEVPKGAKVLGMKEVFKLKVDGDAKPCKYKSRFTVQGCGQRPGVDFQETSASVLKLRSLRVLCALVAQQDLEFKQLDVETAFLHGDLKEKLYARPPPDLTGVAPGQVFLLKKTIYGLKQASHEWQLKLNGAITALGYAQCVNSDECLFVKRSRTGRTMIIATYVDDIPRAYAAQDEAEMNEDMTKLKAQFAIKELGDAEYILGWRIRRNRTRRSLHLDQEGYVTQLLEHYGMDQCRAADTPGTPLEQLRDEAERSDSDSTNAAHRHPQVQVADYASVVGALQYAACSTRPDIAHAVNTLGAFLQQPKLRHVEATKKVLRYLNGTRKLGLTYSPDSHGGLTAFTDADWASDPSDRRSITGYVAKLGGAAISWCSRKQQTVSLSSMESEYIASAETAKEIAWLRRLTQDLNIGPKGAVPVYMDSQSALAVAMGARGTAERRKHIDVKHHFIKEQVAIGNIKLEWVTTDQNQADLFTKALPGPKFKELRGALMGEN